MIVVLECTKMLVLTMMLVLDSDGYYTVTVSWSNFQVEWSICRRSNDAELANNIQAAQASHQRRRSSVRIWLLQLNLANALCNRRWRQTRRFRFPALAFSVRWNQPLQTVASPATWNQPNGSECGWRGNGGERIEGGEEEEEEEKEKEETLTKWKRSVCHTGRHSRGVWPAGCKCFWCAFALLMIIVEFLQAWTAQYALLLSEMNTRTIQANCMLNKVTCLRTSQLHTGGITCRGHLLTAPGLLSPHQLGNRAPML